MCVCVCVCERERERERGEREREREREVITSYTQYTFVHMHARFVIQHLYWSTCVYANSSVPDRDNCTIPVLKVNQVYHKGGARSESFTTQAKC